ncbi:MAG: hypothetical protein V3U14_12825 [candidate division NC10 bacterium]
MLKLMPLHRSDIEQRSAAAAEHYIVPLREGKPELGWEGDPDLHLVLHRLGHWELFRHEPAPGFPDQYRIVAKAPTGQQLNEGAINKLIRSLVDRDTRRPGNDAMAQLDAIDRHNERLEAEIEYEATDKLSATLEKVYYEVGKVDGRGGTIFHAIP